MFFGGFLGTLLLIAAFVMALGSRRRLTDLTERLARTEDLVDRLREDVRRFDGTLRTLVARDIRPGDTAAAPQTSAPPSPSPPISAPPISAPPISAPPMPAPPRAAAQPGPPASVPAAGRRGEEALSPPAASPSSEDSRSPHSGSLEEKLGTQWAVWAGGLALALGGLFLVRYSIEAGLIGPGVRIMLGALLAAALIAAGEWMRRGDINIPIEGLPKAHIPSILTAAGTVVAFGTIYAAYALYGFLGPAAAFVLLGATGLATMLASALHGPWLAGLGLAGAFGTPLLVSSDVPRLWPLMLYLAVVAASAYLLARARGWLWLALAAACGSALWGLVMLGIGAPSAAAATGNASAILAHVLTALGLAAFFFAYEPHLGQRDENASPDWIATGVLAMMTLLVIAYAGTIPFTFWGWPLAVAIAIAMLTLTGWLSAPAAAAIALSGLVALTAMEVWPGLDLPPDRTLLAPYATRLLSLPENVSSFMLQAALWTLPPAAVAAYRIWRGPLLPDLTAALYALAATVPPLLAVTLAYLRITQFDTSISFAFGGAALAFAFALLADRFLKADDAYSVPAYGLASGAFAAAAIAGLAFALTVSLSRGYLTVALALTALGTAYVSSLRNIPLLRPVVTVIGAIVAARMAWDPRIMAEGVGRTPIFNWLLIGYGVPAAAFYASARVLEQRASDLAVRICDSLAVLFTALLAFLEIRHLTNDGDIFHPAVRHIEAGLMTLTSILMSFSLARLDIARRNPVFATAALIAGGAAVLFAAMGLAVAANPYLTGEAVQGRVLMSSLMLAYLLPAIAALYVARNARDIEPALYARAAGVLAVALTFAYVTLEVRHAFQGEVIASWRQTGDPEGWAYSAAWLALGVAFLAYGLLRHSLEARIASAILVALTMLKVTFYDLAGIGGLWRALSFICLGAVLIGIGLVYQRYVFAKTDQPGG